MQPDPALNKSFIFARLWSPCTLRFFTPWRDISPPMPALVGTWQAQWKAAGRTVLKNEVNNLSEHLCPCSSFISTPTPPPPPFLLISFISTPIFLSPSAHTSIKKSFLFPLLGLFGLKHRWGLFSSSFTVFYWTFLQSLFVYSLILCLKGFIFDWYFTSQHMKTMFTGNELMSLVC